MGFARLHWLVILSMMSFANELYLFIILPPLLYIERFHCMEVEKWTSFELASPEMCCTHWEILQVSAELSEEGAYVMLIPV